MQIIYRLMIFVNLSGSFSKYLITVGLRFDSTLDSTICFLDKKVTLKPIKIAKYPRFFVKNVFLQNPLMVMKDGLLHGAFTYIVLFHFKVYLLVILIVHKCWVLLLVFLLSRPFWRHLVYEYEDVSKR